MGYLINEAHQFASQWGVPLAIAFVAVGIRILFSVDRMTVIGVIRGILVGLAVGGGFGAYYLSGEADLTDGQKGAIIGIVAILAEDIIVGVLKLARTFRTDPERIIKIFTGHKK